MVKGINGNSKLGVLLQQKQKKLESINQQKQVVEKELSQINSAALSSKVKVEDKEMSLSDAIVALQNHPYKGMKEPDSSDAKYEIKDTDGESNGYNKAQFDKDMAEFKKAEDEYKDLENGINEQTKELEITKDDLDKMMTEAQKKEDELKDNGAEYDVTYGEIDDLNKQIDEESKTAEIDVTLSKDKNNDTLVEATVNQLKVLQEQGLIDKNIDLKNLKPEQLKKLSEAVVNHDIRNGIVAEGTSLDGTSADYTKMEAGDGRKYTVSQMQDLAKSLNTEIDSDTSYKIIEDTNLDLDKDTDFDIDTKPDSTTPKPDDKKDPNAHYKDGDLTTARGIPYNDKKANGEDWNYTKKTNEKGETVYVGNESNKEYTAKELNKKMRKAEDTVYPGYSNMLDKAEKYGIDIDKVVNSNMTGKQAYDAVKSAVKEAKATEKAEKKALKAQDKVAKADKVTTSKVNETKAKKTDNTKKTPERNHSSLNIDDFLKDQDDVFAEFDAKTKEKIIANFKDGAKGVYNINGTRFSATQKISKSGQKAYLVNGEYYALRRDGLPDLNKKLNKADFE